MASPRAAAASGAAFPSSQVEALRHVAATWSNSPPSREHRDEHRVDPTAGAAARSAVAVMLGHAHRVGAGRSAPEPGAGLTVPAAQRGRTRTRWREAAPFSHPQRLADLRAMTQGAQRERATLCTGWRDPMPAGGQRGSHAQGPQALAEVGDASVQATASEEHLVRSAFTQGNLLFALAARANALGLVELHHALRAQARQLKAIHDYRDGLGTPERLATCAELVADAADLQAYVQPFLQAVEHPEQAVTAMPGPEVQHLWLVWACSSIPALGTTAEQRAATPAGVFIHAFAPHMALAALRPRGCLWRWAKKGQLAAALSGLAMAIAAHPQGVDLEATDVDVKFLLSVLPKRGALLGVPQGVADVLAALAPSPRLLPLWKKTILAGGVISDVHQAALGQMLEVCEPLQRQALLQAALRAPRSSAAIAEEVGATTLEVPPALVCVARAVDADALASVCSVQLNVAHPTLEQQLALASTIATTRRQLSTSLRYVPRFRVGSEGHDLPRGSLEVLSQIHRQHDLGLVLAQGSDLCEALRDTLGGFVKAVAELLYGPAADGLGGDADVMVAPPRAEQSSVHGWLGCLHQSLNLLAGLNPRTSPLALLGHHLPEPPLELPGVLDSDGRPALDLSQGGMQHAAAARALRQAILTHDATGYGAALSRLRRVAAEARVRARPISIDEAFAALGRRMEQRPYTPPPYHTLPAIELAPGARIEAEPPAVAPLPRFISEPRK